MVFGSHLADELVATSHQIDTLFSYPVGTTTNAKQFAAKLCNKNILSTNAVYPAKAAVGSLDAL